MTAFGPPSKITDDRVWIGRFTDRTKDGYLQTIGVMSPQELAVFDRKAILGDATADTDLYTSSYIFNNAGGGAQVEEMNVAMHADRIWTGFAETRFQKQFALPPLVTASRPDDATGSAYPLGDVYLESNNRVSTFYAAFGLDVHGRNEESGTWYPASIEPLESAPVRRGCSFRGRGAEVRLFVPLGDTGYATISEAAPGTPTVINVAQTGTPGTVGEGPETNDGAPGAVDFCVWDNKIYAIASDGQLWWSLTGNADDWHFVLDEVEEPLALDQSRIPRCLVVGVNKIGDPTLYVVSDQDLWAFDAVAGILHLTNFNELDHPDFGLDAVQWRAGEDLWVAYGMDVIRYTSTGVPAPDSGLTRDDGLPIHLRGHITSFAKTAQTLYALVQGAPVDVEDEMISDPALYEDDQMYYPNAGAFSSIHLWTGTGWHGVWQSATSEHQANWMINSRVRNGRRIWWGSSDGFLRSFRVRAPFHAPYQGFLAGIDEFAETGIIELPRFDAGMSAFQKIGTDVSVDMRLATIQEVFDIKYRTNADLTASGADPGYPHLLGSVTTPDLTYFSFNPNGDNFAEGQIFNWIQFAFEMRRRTGGDTPERFTPIMRNFVMHYIKRPQNVRAFSWVILLPPESFSGSGTNKITNRLADLVQAGELLAMVHRGRIYRGYLSGVAGNENFGADPNGVRRLSFLEIPPKQAGFIGGP